MSAEAVTSDRIEKSIVLRAPRARVWRAVSDPAVDYSKEPTTLVEFALEDAAEGTRLTVVESGFDRIPLGRRAEALRMNDAGWAEQVRNIDAHVAGAK